MNNHPEGSRIKSVQNKTEIEQFNTQLTFQLQNTDTAKTFYESLSLCLFNKVYRLQCAIISESYSRPADFFPLLNLCMKYKICCCCIVPSPKLKSNSVQLHRDQY